MAWTNEQLHTDLPLGQYFEMQVAKHADNDFIVYPDRDLRWTYAQFDERVDQLAKGLLALSRRDNLTIRQLYSTIAAGFGGRVLIGTDRIAPALEEARQGTTTHNIGKVNLNRRNGQAFPAQVQVLPVMMKETLVGIEVIFADISENENNKTLTQHLEHRALIGDFTAAFAHDIKDRDDDQRAEHGNDESNRQRAGQRRPET